MSTNENAQPQISEPAPQNSPKAKKMTRAATCHAAPFLLWIGVMMIAHAMHLTDTSATEEVGSLNLITESSLYALRTVLCFVVLLFLRPWKYYKDDPLQRRHILPAIGIGIGIFVLWVGFETQLFKNLAPTLAEAYEKWCIKPLGSVRDPLEVTPYAPAVCGWPLTIIKLIGSAFVIAVIEEFFWRGYMLRTLRTPDFLDIDIGQFHPLSFFAVAAFFALEHHEWAAGLVTGIVYGLFYIRTRDIWAVSIAHVTTNLVLGVYVIVTGHWHFW